MFVLNDFTIAYVIKTFLQKTMLLTGICNLESKIFIVMKNDLITYNPFNIYNY